MSRVLVPLGHVFAACIVAVPAFLAAQQSPAIVPVTPTVATPVTTAPIVPALPTPVTGSVADPKVNAGGEIVVNSGQPKAAPSLVTPIEKPKFDLPPGLVPPPSTATALPSVLPGVRSAPPAKLTPVEIARQIAPQFDVTRDYTRLVQCYGTADFMGAVTRVQAGRPGASQQSVAVARQIMALQDAMQPLVLAASTVRGEAKFRSDYDAFAKRGQTDLAKARDANTVLRPRLATLDACRRDVSRWRGGR